MATSNMAQFLTALGATCQVCGRPCPVMRLGERLCDCSCHAGLGPCTAKLPILAVAVDCKQCGKSVLSLWTPDGAHVPTSCTEHQ